MWAPHVILSLSSSSPSSSLVSFFLFSPLWPAAGSTSWSGCGGGGSGGPHFSFSSVSVLQQRLSGGRGGLDHPAVARRVLPQQHALQPAATTRTPVAAADLVYHGRGRVGSSSSREKRREKRERRRKEMKTRYAGMQLTCGLHVFCLIFFSD